MNRDELLSRFEALNQWATGGQRAPHKPLLILLALGALARGQQYVRFADARQPLTELLRDFGPTHITCILNTHSGSKPTACGKSSQTLDLNGVDGGPDARLLMRTREAVLCRHSGSVGSAATAYRGPRALGLGGSLS